MSEKKLPANGSSASETSVELNTKSSSETVPGSVVRAGHDAAENPDSPAGEHSAATKAPFVSAAGSNWGSRLLLWGILVAVAFVIVAVGMAFLPRWWAQRIGNTADGSMVAATFTGLTVGFVFTLIPLFLVPSMLTMKPRSLGARVALLVTGAILALPNLLTLYISRGTSNAAHAGQRILDVDAGGFRSASVFGAIAGAVVFLGVQFFLWRHRRRSAEIVELRNEVSVKAAFAQIPAPKD